MSLASIYIHYKGQRRALSPGSSVPPVVDSAVVEYQSQAGKTVRESFDAWDLNSMFRAIAVAAGYQIDPRVMGAILAAEHRIQATMAYKIVEWAYSAHTLGRMILAEKEQSGA